jgi:outer membrane protein OmpA-like peptidoglycan-associated protein
MKSKLINTVIVLLLVFAVVFGAVMFFQYSERLLLRSPMLVQEPTIITYMEGPVETSPGDNRDWIPAEIGMKLKQGSSLRTGEGGLADLRVYSEGVIRLLENTQVDLDSLTLKRQAVRITAGTVFARFRLLFDGQDLMFTTPNTAAAVRGTELVFLVNRDETVIHALSGITEVANVDLPLQPILLAFQSTTTVAGGNPPSDPVELSQAQVENFHREFNGINTREVFLISQSINFEPDSAVIVPGSDAELEKVAKLLSSRRENILIAGHTADVGNTTGQMKLSEERAMSIRDRLITLGVPERRLTTIGYGSSRPVGDNSTREGQAKNRRVEFLVVD